MDSTPTEIEEALAWADGITTDDTLYHAKHLNFVIRTLASSYRKQSAELAAETERHGHTLKKWFAERKELRDALIEARAVEKNP